MSTEFSATTVVFGDQPGLGAWEVGHYRQHLRYNDALAKLTNPVLIEVFPILRLVGITKQEVVYWLDAHEKWHELIRPFANVTGVNLSGFDITTPDDWYQWQDLHNAEHLLLDQGLNLA